MPQPRTMDTVQAQLSSSLAQLKGKLGQSPTLQKLEVRVVCFLGWRVGCCCLCFDASCIGPIFGGLVLCNELSLPLTSRLHPRSTQEKTHVPKEYIFIGGAFIFTLAFLSGVGTGTLCNVIGFIFPAIKSVRAIESHASNEVTQWLVYWVVYSFFSVIEIFAETLLYWIPFYYRFKLGFLLWAMLVSSLYHVAEFHSNTLAEHDSSLMRRVSPFSPKHAVRNTSMITF